MREWFSLCSTLYHHFATLPKNIFQEKTKVKALSEELENPMNVHRWRKLEGSDPTTFEMIQKIHTLQKRLISKTEEVRKKLSQEGHAKPRQRVAGHPIHCVPR